MSKFISVDEIFFWGGRNYSIMMIFFSIDKMYYYEFNSYYIKLINDNIKIEYSSTIINKILKPCCNSPHFTVVR